MCARLHKDFINALFRVHLKIVERFPALAAIQDTIEPSSDRLIEEGRPLLRRLSFFALALEAAIRHPEF